VNNCLWEYRVVVSLFMPAMRSAAPPFPVIIRCLGYGSLHLWKLMITMALIGLVYNYVCVVCRIGLQKT